MISPIGADESATRVRADFLFTYVIKQGLAELDIGFGVPIRSDTSDKPGLIPADIFTSIQSADLVVADLSDLNPNVFYELCYADVLLKRTVCFKDTADDLPFDTRHVRVITYSVTAAGLEKARQSFKAAVTVAMEADTVSNPITAAQASVELSESPDSRDRLVASLTSRLESLEGNLKRLSSEFSSDRFLAAADPLGLREGNTTRAVPWATSQMRRFAEERRMHQLIDRLQDEGMSQAEARDGARRIAEGEMDLQTVLQNFWSVIKPEQEEEPE